MISPPPVTLDHKETIVALKIFEHIEAEAQNAVGDRPAFFNDDEEYHSMRFMIRRLKQQLNEFKHHRANDI